MGVSGTGKTTVGKLLAEHLNLPFMDADDFHPEKNVEKMSKGIPLDDSDRKPWLSKLRKEIELQNRQGGAVLACSALKKTYRDILSGSKQNDVRFIYLKGDRETILNRMNQREDHYMPASLLDSQFNTLEEPSPDEAIHIHIDPPPHEIVKEIIKKLY